MPVPHKNGTSYDGTAALNTYHDDGNRVKKVSPSGTTWYLMDDRNPTGYAQAVEEVSARGSVMASCTYGLQLISRKTGTQTTYYGLDGHNNVRFLLSEAGMVSDVYTYDAFGVLIYESNPTPSNPYRYCAEYFDLDLGEYYLRARYYQPQLGRFWTMDSSRGDERNPVSIHKYLYCHEEPINFADPTGHNETGTAIGQLTVTAIQYNSRTLEGVGLAAFRAGAIRGISGAILKTGAYGILALTGAGIAGQIAYIADAIKHNPQAALSAQARRQLQTQVEAEEEDQGGPVIFHYTDAAGAQQIVNDKAIIASEAKPFGGFTFPAGAYATDVPPWSTDYNKRQLSALFYGGNEGRDVSWFVAIAQGAFYELQYPGFPHQYIQQAPAGSKVPVEVLAVGPNLMGP